ncbi:MAG: Asp-tRNA(Asn)/Glu-tRNA(Gln) amidotransferase subunit GatB [Ignavibacteria bacterium]|nr:Asp-tRNA(Asn)/Glu-tRNA(Gln) amidotransferase subunit GatB [Ignavibacteria bacterium]
MSSIYDKYEPVIGLEIHAQMKTQTKAFCKCSTNFHNSPNSNVCPICLGMPGTLPVLNKELLDYAIRMGLATNCSIREKSIFARKNYFYPDLTKGYQITQYETPICYDGHINIKLKNKSEKRIGITRIHMEEDAGKSIHDFSDSETLVDFNRCGVPLIEIVSEPDINSSEEAITYMQKIRQILVYLDICDGNMEEGSLRCDANVSVRLKGSKEFGNRTEIKNLNSFKNVSDAIETEIKRQIEATENGEKVVFATMTYNAKDKTTTATRSKEQAHDYRYFPEPDLVKVNADEAMINGIKSKLPEFPDDKLKRFVNEYSIPEYDAEILTSGKELSIYFENVIKELKNKNEKAYKQASNWVMNDVLKVLNDKKINIEKFNIPEINLAKLIDLLLEEKINKTVALELFEMMLTMETRDGQNPEHLLKEKGLEQVSDTGEIDNIIKKILTESPKEVERYKGGEKKLAGLFVGKIMRESKGKANPKIVNELLLKNLEAL